MNRTVQIFTDGACSGNPGPGGFGVIIKTNAGAGTLTCEYSAGYELTTNNRMELLAVIFGLEQIKPGTNAEIITDSKYVSDAINAGWLISWQKNDWKSASKKSVKNRDLWERYLSAVEGKRVKFTWVKGHAGHPENETCDKLAVDAYSGEDLLVDTGYV